MLQLKMEQMQQSQSIMKQMYSALNAIVCELFAGQLSTAVSYYYAKSL